MDDSKIDVLLRLRREMEGEIEQIRNVLAGKTKALAALNETIDLVRGWTPAENLPKPVLTKYDDDAINEALMEIFGPGRVVRMADLCRELEERGLVPSYSAAVAQKMRVMLHGLGIVQTERGVWAAPETVVRKAS